VRDVTPERLVRHRHRTVSHMASGDGNGWIDGSAGGRHWGRYGAAGLALIRTPQRPQLLLQLRAGWTHEGGTWGLVGGARDSHESVAEAALREAAEEAGVDAALVTVLGARLGLADGDWSYTYVLGLAGEGLRVAALTAESDELRWVGLEHVTTLPLHAGLRATWPHLRTWIDAHLPQAL
jgi:8-oxo-dGTP diphosphatase